MGRSCEAQRRRDRLRDSVCCGDFAGGVAMNRRELLKLFPGALVIAAAPTIITGVAAAQVLPVVGPRTTTVVPKALGEIDLEILRWQVNPYSFISSLAAAELADARGAVWGKYSFNAVCGLEVLLLPEERFVMRGPPRLVVRGYERDMSSVSGQVVTRDAAHPRAVRIYDFVGAESKAVERVAHVTQQRL